MDWQSLLTRILEWAATTGAKLVAALITLFLTFKIINFLARKIERSGAKHAADKTIMRTAANIFKIGAKIIVALCLVGFVGVDTGGIAALVASLGVGIGLAVNGALSNLAGGVIIIMTRPFRIDDYIEAQGFSGTVEDIHITNTKLRTPDNKTIYIPNGVLSSGTIVNYSLQNTRRVDLVFSVSYSQDMDKIKKIILDECASHPLVLKEQEIFVRATEHADSSIKLTLRVWVKSENFWTVKFDLLESIKDRFDTEGIVIPYNRLDVRLKNE